MIRIADNLERRVLHADDDPAILSIVQAALTRRGFSVTSVCDSSEVIPALRTSSTRVVLLDLDMPGKDGLAILREIKKLDGSTQVIMLTGMVSMSTIMKATQLGAEECIFKPIGDLEEVADAVDRAYSKMLRWWKTLREWRERNPSVTPL